MAQDDLDDEVDLDAESTSEEAVARQKKAASRSRLILALSVAIALVVGLTGGGAAGYLIFSGAPEESAVAESAPKEPAITPTIFHDLPKVMVNLKSARCRGLYLKLQMVAELGSPEDSAAVRTAHPVIQDGIESFIRSQTKADLDGKEGTENFRANVVAIVENAVQPIKVRGVLFKEILLQ